MHSTPRRRGTQSARSRAAALVAVLGLSAALATAVHAGGATVTRGDFAAFAAGAGLEITGQAQMVRTADGRTIVSIHLEGLDPNVTYAAHVHAAACAANSANGHYKFDPAGAAVPPNEIWPGPFTSNDAGIGNGGTIADGTAGPTAVSVVVHAPGGAKIACADLE
jgi:hypothetical protein